MSGMRKDDDMRILISNDDGIFAPGIFASNMPNAIGTISKGSKPFLIPR